MNPAVYAVVAVIAILFVLACRHIYHATIGGGGCCGGGGDCPACRERKMKTSRRPQEIKKGIAKAVPFLMVSG